jgi:hypothetical protein
MRHQEDEDNEFEAFFRAEQEALSFRGLCSCECPCSLDLADFCVGGLSWAGAHKSSGDEGAS